VKKVIVALLLLCIFFSGCTHTNSSEPVVEIKDKMFIQQINDIYLNPGDYENKTIKLEGIYDVWQDETDSNRSRFAVYRRAPGCCGDDGKVGFEFEYNGEKPILGDWVAVEGRIKETFDEHGDKHIILELSKLTVKDERGVEFVEN